MNGKKIFNVDKKSGKLNNFQFSTFNFQLKQKAAFTLAEVLIVIAIIGVVAAMTLNSLIHNIQAKVLENQFKTAVSRINETILLAKMNLEVGNLKKYCTEYNSSYINSAECFETFNNILVNKNKYKYRHKIYDISRNINEIKTYNNKECANSGNCYSINDVTRMPNGSYIGIMINCSNVSITADINGSKKPNRLGHDIFVFKLDNNDKLVAYDKPSGKIYSDEELENIDNDYTKASKGCPCNTQTNQKLNGVGCSYYALQDICPQTGKNGYFKCLPK